MRVVPLLLATLLLVALPATASAHERRDVGATYQFVVGFISEPAILGEPNGVDLRITNKETNQPVQGAEKTLKVAVQFGGGAPKEMPLRARFGQPGAYTADLIPTRAGSYIFTFTGDLEGTAVNEKFESGPGRFNDVQAADQLQFPETVPYAGELQRQLRDAEARTQQATTFAYAGVALGLLGTVVGLAALLRRPTVVAAAPGEVRRAA
jgi:hypothetical protein